MDGLGEEEPKLGRDANADNAISVDEKSGIATEEEQQREQEAAREELEAAMNEMSEKMGIVILGDLLNAFTHRIDRLQELLHRPRSFVSLPPSSPSSWSIASGVNNATISHGQVNLTIARVCTLIRSKPRTREYRTLSRWNGCG
jgi:uncharacterized membrane protein YccC